MQEYQDIIDNRVSEEEKQDLYAQESSTYSGLNAHNLWVALGILAGILFFSVPKIYLSSTIYYKSREISSLQTQYDMLLDENKRLKHELEDLRYEFLIQ
ncbi:hypothetical protein LS68_005580 [Helicobacter sp. MIT 05-5293]|uniref:hypothetical protein n=1 Tax=Helicobacter sp. MIT 05-5293 TaxID=1548149 RepID=UPI00051D2F8F|nr:hypothetical protein [Helicobacter sp. MIT 05-5293]TLD80942.1 hypothetical protein LS68_005580 [Helicobacter sp. MIT 05-5293]